MANYKVVNNVRVQLTPEEEVEFAADEKKAAEEAPIREMNIIRDMRNEKLAETDWMANSDLTMSEEWKTYRQALRDITNTSHKFVATGHPLGTLDIDWPIKPA